MKLPSVKCFEANVYLNKMVEPWLDLCCCCMTLDSRRWNNSHRKTTFYLIQNLLKTTVWCVEWIYLTDKQLILRRGNPPILDYCTCALLLSLCSFVLPLRFLPLLWYHLWHLLCFLCITVKQVVFQWRLAGSISWRLFLANTRCVFPVPGFSLHQICSSASLFPSHNLNQSIKMY